MDKLKHFLLCFAVTVIFGWKIGLTVGLTIEIVQAEAGNADVKIFLRRLFSKDSLLDLVANTVGVGLGLFVKKVLF